MRIYILNIYQSEEDNPHNLVGIIKEIGAEGKKAFSNFDELWKILNLMKKESNRCKKHMDGNNNKCTTENSIKDKDNDLKYPELVASIKNQFLLSGNQVIPNLSGEYVAFEDLSTGKYLIKLWHVRTGAVFEIRAGLVLNAPTTPKMTAPCTQTNPKCKR
jgi:hypothetical protein